MQDDIENFDTEDSEREEENLAPAIENAALNEEAAPEDEEISFRSEKQIVPEELKEVEIPEDTEKEKAADETAESEETENGEESDDENGEEDSALPISSVVEAVLFAAREPLKLAHIARAVGKRIRQDAVKSAIDELNVLYLETGRAFEIAEISGKYQLMSRPEYVNHIVRIYPKRELSEKERSSKLTPAALDTLSIIAYKQPVTRGEIEHIRGVGCGPVLRALIERGSVKVAGKRTDLVGQPLLYGTTDAFLAEFGLGTLEELPLRSEFLAMADEFAPSPAPDQLPAPEEAGQGEEVESAETGSEPESKVDSEEPDEEIIAPTPLFSRNLPDDDEPPPAI